MKKIYSNLKLLILLVFLSATMLNCEYQKTDFGNDGSIKGIVKDNQGNLLYGDILTNNLVVNLLGEGDQQAIQIRVKGDGTYQNTKMYPKKHLVWVTGPIVNSEEIYYDFSVDVDLVKDFVLTPYISPKVISGTVSGTSVNVEYSIVENAGKTATKSEVYCSTAQYPTSSIGSYGTIYSTKTVLLSSLTGTATVSGLTSGKKYYIRIGSLADGTTLMNYSNQVIVTIP